MSIRSPLCAAERVIHILHDTKTQTSREHKWAILCTPNKSLAYKQGSIFTPECTQDPRVEAKLVLVTKLRTADLTWVLSGRGGVTGTAIFSRRDPLAFVSGRSNRRITRGHKLLIITRQLWRWIRSCAALRLSQWSAPRFVLPLCMQRRFLLCMHAALHSARGVQAKSRRFVGARQLEKISHTYTPSGRSNISRGHCVTMEVARVPLTSNGRVNRRRWAASFTSQFRESHSVKSTMWQALVYGQSGGTAVEMSNILLKIKNEKKMDFVNLTKLDHFGVILLWKLAKTAQFVPNKKQSTP